MEKLCLIGDTQFDHEWNSPTIRYSPMPHYFSAIMIGYYSFMQYQVINSVLVAKCWLVNIRWAKTKMSNVLIFDDNFNQFYLLFIVDRFLATNTHHKPQQLLSGFYISFQCFCLTTKINFDITHRIEEEENVKASGKIYNSENVAEDQNSMHLSWLSINDFVPV